MKEIKTPAEVHCSSQGWIHHIVLPVFLSLQDEIRSSESEHNQVTFNAGSSLDSYVTSDNLPFSFPGFQDQGLVVLITELWFILTPGYDHTRPVCNLGWELQMSVMFLFYLETEHLQRQNKDEMSLPHNYHPETLVTEQQNNTGAE